MNKLKNISALLLFFTVLFFSACEIEPFEGTIPNTDNPIDPALLPVLTTTNHSSLLTTSAISGGTITADGGTAVIARGVVWSTAASPTTANSKTVDGTGIGSFTSSITGLTAGTTYYVRAYATNSSGTAYGNQITFTTISNPSNFPVVTTTVASGVTSSSASSGGNVTADGGSPVTVRGVVWSTTTGPTTANSKTVDGTGTGSFTSAIGGLAASTVYYVRAYATNVNGTAYGNQVTFTTAGGASNLPVLTTTAITNNTAPNATSGGNITSDGGSPITDRGVVWGYSANFIPASNRTTSDGTGTGSFVSHITPTMPGQVYYVRAYARNINGISYGNELVFTGSVGSVDNSPALMTANINGVQYDHMQPYLYSLTHNDVSIWNNGAPAGDPRYLGIQGDTSDNLGSLTEIFLYIPNVKWVPGTYSLIERDGLDGPTYCQGHMVLPTGSSAVITGGSITITEFNLTTKRIKGTFTITYDKRVNGNVVGSYQVTNGTFNYGLDDPYFN